MKKVYNESGWVETVIYDTKEHVLVKNVTGEFDYYYIYHNGQMVAQVNPDGSKIFMHPDHLGSVSVVTNETGDVVENTTYLIMKIIRIGSLYIIFYTPCINCITIRVEGKVMF